MSRAVFEEQIPAGEQWSWTTAASAAEAVSGDYEYRVAPMDETTTIRFT